MAAAVREFDGADDFEPAVTRFTRSGHGMRPNTQSSGGAPTEASTNTNNTGAPR